MLKWWFLVIPTSRSCRSLNHLVERETTFRQSLALNLTAFAALSIKRSFALALVGSRRWRI
ncbi:hypothetical protein PIB30_028784 [Stylosanthes scabra]|uniref:Uncharacterized protein n=1 Tax=Stylosanthes scabra TaxID=79078 RepID=A0ABU6QB76_9FABA|nr:hypothetical protein [Stylosanthes scabra]